MKSEVTCRERAWSWLMCRARGIEGLTHLFHVRLRFAHLASYFLPYVLYHSLLFLTHFLLCITLRLGTSLSLGGAGEMARDAALSSARSRAGDAPHLRDLADHHGGERGLGEGEATLVAGGRRRLRLRIGVRGRD